MPTGGIRHRWFSSVLRGGALLFAIAWGSAWSPGVHAGSEPASNAFRMEVGGLMFGDLYHVASSHSEKGDGATGAVLRRGYLTFDAGFGRRWDARLRLEANQSGEYEQYDFKTDYKDVHVGLNFGEGGRQRLTIGLAPTPTFDVIEAIWGRRYLARTPLDLQGIASRDTGIFRRNSRHVRFAACAVRLRPFPPGMALSWPIDCLGSAYSPSIYRSLEDQDDTSTRMAMVSGSQGPLSAGSGVHSGIEPERGFWRERNVSATRLFGERHFN